MQSSRFFFGLLIVIVISTTYIFVGGVSLGPRFNITNNSAQDVTVTAAWLEKKRDLGILEPGSTIKLTVRDEASMVFNVRYNDGRDVASEAVSFTNGVTTNVSIAEDTIDIQQSLDN